MHVTEAFEAVLLLDIHRLKHLLAPYSICPMEWEE
jgi:hypothetical protein